MTKPPPRKPCPHPRSARIPSLQRQPPLAAATSAASSSLLAAPVVGYFPTGYDALAAAEHPCARLFRHDKHPNPVDLVVSAPGGEPNFVGRSYPGEIAAPQLCSYALGVLDKASLKVVSIAANKMLNGYERVASG